jgi:hypothetical protein
VLVVEWGFRPPMASAMLKVWCSVYDVRVREMLNGYRGLDAVRFERMWKGYRGFISAVKRKAPSELLRSEKDRWLWGRSRYEALLSRL